MSASKGFIPYLAVLSMLGFLATDMYLPAFGAMQQSFNTSAGMISASMSLFLAGFACGQLVWGPLSDRIGRKPVLLAGLSLFALGCAGMLWVDDVVLMLVLRFIQAIGVCAAAVSWQAWWSIAILSRARIKSLPLLCRWSRCLLRWPRCWEPG